MANNPPPYRVDFKLVDSEGATKFSRTLGGSHRAILNDVQGPLDVSLEEIPDPATGTGTFRLTLTENATGPRGTSIGTWPYEIFLVHQLPNGLRDEATLAGGSHFVSMTPQTSNLLVELDELLPKPGVTPRLHFTFKDLPA